MHSHLSNPHHETPSLMPVKDLPPIFFQFLRCTYLDDPSTPKSQPHSSHTPARTSPALTSSSSPPPSAAQRRHLHARRCCCFGALYLSCFHPTSEKGDGMVDD